MRRILKTLIAGAALLASPAYAGRPCPDADADGYKDVACGGTDCNDAAASVNPGAAEVCGDAVDNNCSGVVDEGCSGGSGPHAGLTWTGYAMCRGCHAQQANDVFASGHYQWNGAALYNVNDAGTTQGKYQSSINSYCVNILGNWDGINAARAGACSACHVGRGLEPVAASSAAQLDNIDCLICHQDGYKRKFDATTGQMVADTAAMTITMDQAVQTLHRPTRASCLQCHAKAGGGDAVKRGDMALAQIATTDGNYDVHMATTRGDLKCTSCHAVQRHRIAGSGTDLRVVDLDVEMKCAQCHPTKETSTGHATLKVNDHVGRVACQTCHIPRYARNAADTAADEATEIHRDWAHTHNATPPIHPARTSANDLLPRYAFWNRYSNSGLLFDTPALDPATGAYPTSRPVGGINDTASKLYPFKYKTSNVPFATNRGQFIALDTSTFFATGNATQAVADGLVNMGYASSEPWTWVTSDTYQLVTHTVPPASGNVLGCASCHESTAQLNLAALGYVKKADLSVICTQCHALRAWKGYAAGHDTHVTRKQKDCSICHAFTRPERNLSTVIR
ncbi:MopE-related protein [Anaeromyxobacter sp. Fw109-5]|uniref:MopE-related protein n=1 Tax=Anaeromyxobacter sp. (strain Fw109-5) TaxID=404589 RepID=UPI0000ED790C|nr:MopE-related protein [Anaeromyxobacter sp. Fw109-5]ABS24984.1 hypothetical protein Anae109_0772 [Anaeromyxobacter sp. Fw109-5]